LSIIDNNKLNNRIDNLQSLSARHNKIKSSKSLGKVTGAYKHGKKWCSKIRIDGKNIYLGVFETAQAAHNAYIFRKDSI
jgi:hypothetical protein